jgi:putative nucleotidyltransferase with HDIG domain
MASSDICFNCEKHWLCDYVRNFLEPEHKVYNENILLKRRHSLLVADHMLKLADYLKLNEHDRSLAGVIGLFHDIGRFKQYRDFKTFSDRESLYHGDLGIQVLEETGKLDEFPPSTASLMKTAIHNHGLPAIEYGLNERELQFSMMIRDADKMDIYRIVDAYYKEMLTGKRNISLELGLKNEDKLSSHILEQFMNEKTIMKSDMIYLNDFKLLQIAWIYDLNFTYTQRYVRESGYLDSIIDNISVPEVREKVRKKAKSYLA